MPQPPSMPGPGSAPVPVPDLPSSSEPDPVSVPAGSLPDYAELQCSSNFSFLKGASHPEELVERAAQLGYSALALTDECSLAGVVRAHTEAKKFKLHLIIGSQFQLTHEDKDGGSAVWATRSPLSLILLAQNRDGYGNLCELITLARTRGGKKGSYRITPQDLSDPDKPHRHLRGMPDCLAILTPIYGIAPEVLARQAEWMRGTFPGRCRIALTLLQHGRDEAHRRTVEHAAQEYGMPVVATGNVLMHVRSRKPLQDTLTAIRAGHSVADCGFLLAPNAEQHLRARVRLANLYPAHLLQETIRVAKECKFSLDELRYEYPDELVPPGDTPATYLRKETYIGAHWRYPAGIPHKVQQQIEHELKLIAEMEYEPYFLTVYDIVRFARGERILCQGRGSAANSAVCYCLGVTEVDPSRGNLLFERFVSKERNEPPDIDVDFEHDRREEVIQYIYGKYGRTRAALAAVVISYRPKSVLRDVGKALGIDLHLVERISKAYRWWDGRANLEGRMSECGFDSASQMGQNWLSMADKLMGFPRHLSQHPGGFVIARGKLSRLVPIENAAMPDRSVVQWDKDDLDALGLLKVDVLALGMLSALRRALDFIAQQRGEPFELQDIPKEDPATYAMISKADTVGTFQIESRAQMSMLPRMKPREFYDLVIQIAIVRPGPIQGGMVHPYLRRRQGMDPVSYPSEKMKQALSRTLGVPIFQEQVMQVAMSAADFTPGEADQMRRAMAAWKRKGGLEKFAVKLQDGMRKNGYEDEFIESIIRQIQGFAEYGFPESHSASFALLAYASAWVKCHEPAAFLAALLNSQPMGFYSPSQLVQDARRHGVEVRPVNVQHSGWEATLEGDHASASGSAHVSGHAAKPAVRLGLNLVRGLTQAGAQRIEEARAIKPFADLNDAALRAQLSRQDLEALAHANALVSLSGHRRQALWQAIASAPDRDLMRHAAIDEDRIMLQAPSEGQEIASDYRAFGLTLGRHPLALLRPLLAKRRFVPSDILNTFADRQLARGCGIVTVRQRPPTANGVMFVTLEDEAGVINVVVWPSLVEKQRQELLSSTLLGVYGVWHCENNVRHLLAMRLVNLSHLMGRLDVGSRDFA